MKMADDNSNKGQAGGPASAPESDKEKQTGDPGRTPGKAEGDEDTVDASLQQDEDNKPLH